jgi:hypothetical protein
MVPAPWFVDVDHGVERFGQSGVKAVAAAVGIWPVDDSNGPLLAFLCRDAAQARMAAAQGGQKAPYPGR